MAIDFLAIGAHADDVEIGAAGTILKHSAAGKQIIICDLTYAELSSNGNVVIRENEAKKAAQTLRVKKRINLGIPDRKIELSTINVQKLVKVIREYRPKIILAPYWEDRHPDHEHCSRLVREAVFSSGIRKFAPEMGDPHQSQLYYYFINDFIEPDFCVDITNEYNTKLDSLRCYESQFALAQEHVNTPLNNGYLELIQSREYVFGRKIGKGYAEGFITRGPLSLDYIL